MFYAFTSVIFNHILMGIHVKQRPKHNLLHDNVRQVRNQLCNVQLHRKGAKLSLRYSLCCDQTRRRQLKS